MHTGLEYKNTARKFVAEISLISAVRDTSGLADALRALADRIESEKVAIAGLSGNVIVYGSVVGEWRFAEGVRD